MHLAVDSVQLSNTAAIMCARRERERACVCVCLCVFVCVCLCVYVCACVCVSKVMAP
jgi:hypothetical protein